MRAWLDDCIAKLASHAAWGYHHEGPPASEPTALAALALAARRPDDALRAARWLEATQSADGSVGVTREQSTPAWPTSLAVLAWGEVERCASGKELGPHKVQLAHGGQSSDGAGPSLTLRASKEQAVAWLLATKGEIVTETEPLSHDRTLVGWPWIGGTHSWIEPTAFSVLALKAAGHAQHARTREAVRLLVDRLLPTGGCNYGNTFVLGQKLLPHVQPTGICLLAIAGEEVADPRIARSINYLHHSLSETMAVTSFCYGLLGLVAHGERPKQAEAWLAGAYERECRRGRSSHKLALLALAALEADSPFLALPQRPAA